MMSDYAFVNIGGSATSDWAGMVRNVPAAGGYSEYAALIGPKFQASGCGRMWVHNPGGLWVKGGRDDPAKTPLENRQWAEANHKVPFKNTRVMWIDQWIQAKLYGCSWADDREVRIFHDRMMADYNATEVVYYFGGPDHAAFSYEFQKACMEPFVYFEGASFGFDHIVKTSEFEGCFKLFKWIQRTNKTARIYTEARPTEDIPKPLLRNVNGTVATAGVDANRPDDLERAKAIGEVIRIVDRDDAGNWPAPEEGVTHAMRGVLN